MVMLTCLVRRKPGMSPEQFHRYWREHHGPLVASTESGSHVVRYEQHHRALEDYGSQDDGGFDGVTVQWFESRAAYDAHVAAPDFRTVWADIEKFLDVDRLVYVLTDDIAVIVDAKG
ncbi:MAG TPA: EthD domain-containing protein [Acidimicrobiales bacterium]|nr:EthD domain-containing protein [Acidimicrobiales bacterium]